MNNQFKILFLIGRPAAGKSEIIDYLKKMNIESRQQNYYIADFDEIDDFPMLWTWFEEDEILEKMGKQRLHTDKEGYFKEPWLWDLLIRRMELEYTKKLHDNPHYEDNHTVIIEFARGAEHGGFQKAFKNFTPTILKKSAILYLNVSFKESLRKNRKRFNPDKPYSILEHSLPDEKLTKMYKDSDWEEFSSDNSNYIEINSVKVPYAVFENEDDVTTAGGDKLGKRLKEVLLKLKDRQKAL